MQINTEFIKNKTVDSKRIKLKITSAQYHCEKKKINVVNNIECLINNVLKRNLKTKINQ